MTTASVMLRLTITSLVVLGVALTLLAYYDDEKMDRAANAAAFAVVFASAVGVTSFLFYVWTA